MKREMKMKKPLLLILSGLSLSGLVVATEADKTPTGDDMWSVNGGVFHPVSDSSNNDLSNKDQVLIKDARGMVRIVNQAQANSANQQLNQVTIYVDRTAPVISHQWLGALEREDGVVIGPDSEVHINVNEAGIKRVLIDGIPQQSSGMTHRIRFQQAAHSIMIEAEDEYNNSSQNELALIADFEPPNFSWQLQQPAIQVKDQWFAGAQAEIRLRASDNVAMGTVQLNGQAVEWQDNAMSVKVGDELQVIDALGNTKSEKLVWEIDSTPPYMNVTLDNESHQGKNKINVRVNELIDLTTLDLGVGVKHQKYKGKSRKWQSLPKKFRFTSKGNYRLKVFSEDQVGNTLETTLKFKVKR